MSWNQNISGCDWCGLEGYDLAWYPIPGRHYSRYLCSYCIDAALDEDRDYEERPELDELDEEEREEGELA
jgi:hypothetical protein